MKGLFEITVITTVLSVTLSQSPIVFEEFIATINSNTTMCTARNNFENYTTEQLKVLAGVIGISRKPKKKFPRRFHKARYGIPAYFDSREIWPQCESLRTIRNQGLCGSCWAFAAVEVMSDRLCIFTAGKEQFTFSPEALISCCPECGNCHGGDPIKAFQFWVDHGIPSGGDEGSNLGCRPYTAAKNGQTPQCNERCVSGYNKTWKSDIRHGTAAFRITNTTEQMQHEIVINGPIVVIMQVFEDLFNYTHGVYKHTAGDLISFHAVKILGWGNDNDTPYWLVANSWGTGWGEDGFFKILRGSNHVGVEDAPIAGNPNINE